MDGINAFIENCPDDIHLEFKLAGILPEKWEIQDSLGILYYMGYSTSANLDTEITAQMLLETLGYEKTSLLLPVNINADDPDDRGKMQMPPQDQLSLAMAIGRTDHIALSATNNYGDMLDLYIETIDPQNPDNFLEGNRSLAFSHIPETLKIKDKDHSGGYRQETITIRATPRGPVVSHVFPDLKTQKVITMRFAPLESMGPDIGLFDILTAKNSQDLVKAIKQVPMVCLNWVFADTSGNIGHQASGKIPLRSNGNGTFPFPIKDATDNWQGWIPQDQMPGTLNPEKKWIGTCNQKTIQNEFPHYYSSYFAPSFRYRRLKELMGSSDRKSVDGLWM